MRAVFGHFRADLRQLEYLEPRRIGVVTYYGTAPGMCASPTLPFGTVVTITNPQNGDTTHCTVDDREADSARQIDLSTETFATIAPLSQGVITDAELSW